MTGRSEQEKRRDWRAGVGAALIAEAVFTGVGMMVHKLRGKSPWKITRLPGSILFGPSVTKPPGFVPRDIAKGMFAHFVFSVAVGLLYPKLVRKTRAGPIGAGLRTSATLFALGFVILPYVLLPRRTAPMRLPPKSFALNAMNHVVYGVTFGLAYRLLARRRGLPTG